MIFRLTKAFLQIYLSNIFYINHIFIDTFFNLRLATNFISEETFVEIETIFGEMKTTFEEIKPTYDCGEEVESTF